MGFIIDPYRFNTSVLSQAYGWWMADSFALADNTAVGGVGLEWQDQSTQNRDAAQAVAANQPLFKTAIFGAMPAIRFDGVNDSLVFSQIGISYNPFTVILVGKSVADTNQAVLASTLDTSLLDLDRLGGVTASTYNGTAESISTVFGTAFTNVKMTVFKGSSLSNTMAFRENKTARGTNVWPAGGNMSLDSIGGSANIPNFANWDIGELIIWNDIISVADLDALYDSYLAAKWGLP